MRRIRARIGWSAKFREASRFRGLGAVWLAGVLLVSAPGVAWALPFDSIVAFGDSLSDVGDGPPEPPDFGGRHSNGPVWTEILAGSLGIDSSDFHSFAIGGATSGVDGLAGAGTGLRSQVDAFVAAPPDLGAMPLFTVWAGGNDAIGAALSGATGDLEAVADTAASNIASAVTALAEAGARHFLIPNLFDGDLLPLASLPIIPGSGDSTGFSVAFNERLDAAIAGLERDLGVDIARLDAFALFDAIVADPEAFGLDDTTGACTNLFGPGDSICADPDRYLFWDEIHPTTKAHGFIAGEALRAVPEPTAGVLLGLALSALARSPRRRA